MEKPCQQIIEMITIKRTDSSNTDLPGLIRELDKDLRGRYGAEQEHFDQFNKIENLETVVIAYAENEPVGCGCFKEFDSSSVEVKRMFVAPGHQRKGIGASILKELEKWAAEIGYNSMILETGTRQQEAIRLYQKIGYQIIPNFSPYIGNELSVCMKKELNT
jgi:GNAT superfamily N-acetyltransferase